MQLWGGIECTVNRIGDHFFDQIERNGHAWRAADLDLCAALGLRKLRYPVLWERVAPHGLARADWSWTDQRLDRLRRLGITPIAGLVHHGSGPRETDLTDPGFPEKLASYARAVAERYPWLQEYTPVNEPLTTARFSGLYGHWYPHAQDPLVFARCLLNQCRATVLAMHAIREVNPDAQLIQTEDLGKTHSVPSLAYQADFENERRWLSFDLLCGRIRTGHPMHHYLRWLGVTDPELDWFCEHPCLPDIFGINHYITSERFLDNRLEHYPPWTYGDNGREKYADIEAVRVSESVLEGPKTMLQETWDRYHLPLAMTEVHIGCTPDEQMRWLWDVWQAAQDAHDSGIDVRAVTVWALFGNYDWDSLLTRSDGHYEPGAYDTSLPLPQPTPLADLIRVLTAGQTPAQSLLQTPGWWRRPDRLIYPPVSLRQDHSPVLVPA